MSHDDILFSMKKTTRLQPSRLPQQISYVMYMPNGKHL
ncbi:hypothetical protein C2W59_03468 [Bacillus pumilus]|uniref:Uncharacterized protein n=1 Tax=Bacillus pumilus TaxID=1408 RepID=A0AB34QYI4_BACPU|nr:hypothetical protein B4127_0223 [Bacillus pumilus]RAP11024.1 hypothetical protein C2W58_03930 [Bacillus pumilus]RAP22471.1 hypothetical protein C2W59_03468 [Bacillus pumilus]